MEACRAMSTGELCVQGYVCRAMCAGICVQGYAIFLIAHATVCLYICYGSHTRVICSIINLTIMFSQYRCNIQQAVYVYM